jgi:23S rRNA (pseudouridine1915-N3)-methyltransferase
MKLITIKSSNSKWLDLAADEYLEKINYFQKFEMIALSAAKKSRDDKEFKKKSESDQIMKALKPQDYLILLDEKGKSFGSREFAKRIESRITQNGHNIVFLIGGAYGVEDVIKNRANELVSLSGFVYNHHVATLVILEQIYRAFTIIKNLPYHND